MPTGDPAIPQSMTPARTLPHHVLVLLAICGACGIIGWAFWLMVFRGEPAQDWMVFYTAARAFFDDNLPLIFDRTSPRA